MAVSSDPTVYQFLIVAAGIFLGFYIHSLIGFAAALIALPIIAQALSIKEGISLLSIYVLAFSAIFGYKEWRHINWPVLSYLAIGMIPGVLAGTWALAKVDPDLIKSFLGLFILLFVASSYLKTDKTQLSPWTGLPFGIAGGVFSVLFAAAGPPFAIYTYSRLSSARQIRATLIGILFVNSLARVPALAAANILTANIWLWALYLSPVFVIAIFLGNKTHQKLNAQILKNTLMALLTFSAITLIIR